MANQDIENSPFYRAQQEVIDGYRKQSQENYRKDQQAKDPRITTSRTIETNNQISRKERDEAKRIQRELKRFAATGRMGRFLEETFQKNSQQNNLDNNSPNSTTSQSSPLAESPKITSSGFSPYTGKTEVQNTFIPLPVETSRCILGLRSQNKEIWLNAGTIGNFTPVDWGGDPINGKLIASSGSGYVYAKIEINSNGNASSVEVGSSNSVPIDTNTSFYCMLGYYEYLNGQPKLTNYGCGPIDVSICRNWFASENPFYSVHFNR